MRAILTVILTGGGSRRMGRDKAALPAEGGTMSQTLIERYSKLGPVAVSVDRAGRFDRGQAIELVDSYPGMGPLNGLFSAFTQRGEELVFLTGTDLPFGDAELARLLAGEIGGHDACVIKRGSGQTEPLFAIYRRSCLPAVGRCLEGGKLAFADLFAEIDVRYIDESGLEGWELDRLLMNMNTPQDYEKYREIRRRT